MSVNININNFLNNLGISMDSTAPVNSSEGTKVLEGTVISQLKNMLSGDIFFADIVSQNGRDVVLKMPDGGRISARMEGDFSVLQKDTAASAKNAVAFMVTENIEGKIALKALDTGEQNFIMANKALEAAGLMMNKSNLDMVKALIDNNMPIDKNTLTAVAKELMKFPDSDLNTVVKLLKLEMPVTAENIAQYEAYKSYEHSISNTVDTISQELPKLFEALAEKGDITAIKNILNSITGEQEEVAKTDIEKKSEQQNSAGVQEQQQEGIEKTDSGYREAKDILSKEELNLLKNILKNDEISQKSSKDLLKALIDNQTDSEFFKKDTVRKLIKDVFREEFHISPKHISEAKEVKEFYKSVLSKATELESQLASVKKDFPELSNTVSSLKQNIHFMNELNQHMQFVQLPVKFQENTAHGDLYVYTRKRTAGKQEDTLTALLHLDMENLGPMDVYVKLSNTNYVSTNFCLETEEMLDFVYEHIDILNERLEKLGFHFNATMTIKEDVKQVDFEKDFIEKQHPVIPITKYMFDRKA